MKKIFTLLLAFAGIVSTASATDITRRIVVENQMASWTEWNNDVLYIYAYTTEGEVKLTGNWGDATMTKQGSYTYSNETRRVFYYDITADESVFQNSISIIVFNETGKGIEDAYNRIKWEGVYSADMIVYIYPGEYASYSTQPLSYYFVKSDGSNLSTLTYSQETQKATGTFNHSEGTTYAVLAPNYALWDNFAGIRDWSLVYRPNSDGDAAISSFANYSGTTKTSASSGGSFAISYASDYGVDFDVNDKTFTITPYFERDITSAGIATFSSDYAVAIPSGISASYITGVGENNVLTTTAFANGIPANTGALLEGTAGTYKFTPATTTDEVSDNKLVAATTGVEISQTDGGNTNYILTTQTVDNENAPARFYMVNNNKNTVSAGKAYLQLPTTSARDFFFIWNEDATSIEAVAQQRLDGQAYNLAGQRVAQPAKGLYIVNGKKVILK